MENRWKQKPFHVVIFGGADKDRTDLHGASPFVHCLPSTARPQVFFSNGSLYPLAEISGNLEVSLKSFFWIVSSCFGSKTCLKSTAEKSRKSMPMRARSVSCPLHSQRKIDQSFPQLGGHAAILTGSQSGQRFLWPAWRDPFVGSLWFAKKTSLCFVL